MKFHLFVCQHGPVLFEGAGSTTREARAALRAVLAQHAKDFNLPRHFFHREDCVERIYETGLGYRDHETIPTQETK